MTLDCNSVTTRSFQLAKPDGAARIQVRSIGFDLLKPMPDAVL
jgi:hypothetical protein